MNRIEMSDTKNTKNKQKGSLKKEKEENIWDYNKF